jgi:molybdopterin-containing oxidoreductase family iron-sulfur binding subunit
MKRRDFLKVMGVTGAGVAAAGCSTGKVERLIPYVIPSEDIVPGTPTYYTTTCRECPAGCGIVVETHEGRATKVEGNPAHPISRGNTCARGQASVQGLYHPDRYQGPFVQSEQGLPGRNVGWGQAEQELAAQIRAAGPGGVVLLTGNYGPTMSRLADDFARSVGGRRVVWAPLEDAPRDLDFADTDLLVAFGADFLETWGSPVDYAWQFAQMHGYRKGHRGKLVWVGPHRPLTGINADQWIAPKPGTEALVAMALSGAMDTASAAQQTGLPAQVLERLAQEFRAAGPRAMALGPGAAVSGKNVSALQSAVDRLNGGRAASAPRADFRPVLELVQQMKAGQVKVLLIDAPNPVYGMPGGVGFAAALAKVPVRVSFSSFPDETAQLCNFILPDHHFLEAWDDYAPRAGVLEIVQPVLRPVFNTKQVGDVLLSVAAKLGVTPTAEITASTFYDYLRANWAGRATGNAWNEAVKRGGLFPAPATPGTGALGFLPLVAGVQAAAAPAAPAIPAVGAPPVTAAPAPAVAAAPPVMDFEGDANGLHLVVYPSYRFFDGRNANRPWLLELPDPVTKVSWDSWVEIHPETAKERGIAQGDVLRLASPHGQIEVRAYLYPGVRRDTVAVQMGLGHEAFGRFTEKRGANPMRLLGATADPATGAWAPYGVKVTLEKTGEGNQRFGYSNPEGIFESGQRVQHDRELAQAVSFAEITRLDAKGPGVIPGRDEPIEELRGNGGFAPRKRTTDPASYPPPGTEFGEYLDGEVRWAMVMDLSRCIGCAACVVACNAENNIPVVGPTELRRGRELNWLRIERYFTPGQDRAEAFADDATDDVRFLPMLCQQCGNAPCEPVCPVYAAYHTPDGLNGQVYNRCVGTRYCANNCPYKVRVFNWFTYDFAEPLNWQLNPDVTVREKGVMEKCTFCVQRIHEVERHANVENRPVRDGEVVPACVQTCPTEVFVFGNIQDPNSAVAQAATSNRGYRALGELNTQPAIVYLSKVTLEEPRRGGHHAAEAPPAPFGNDEPAPQETH